VLVEHRPGVAAPESSFDRRGRCRQSHDRDVRIRQRGPEALDLRRGLDRAGQHDPLRSGVHQVRPHRAEVPHDQLVDLAAACFDGAAEPAEPVEVDDHRGEALRRKGFRDRDRG